MSDDSEHPDCYVCVRGKHRCEVHEPENECSCPLCPLAEMNLQVCDVRVKLKKPVVSWHDVKFPSDYVFTDKAQEAFIKTQFLNIALNAKNSPPKLPVGKAFTWDKPELKCLVQHVKKHCFKMCFHAIGHDSDSEDEPIPCSSCGADKNTPCDEATCPFRIANRARAAAAGLADKN